MRLRAIPVTIAVLLVVPAMPDLPESCKHCSQQARPVPCSLPSLPVPSLLRTAAQGRHTGSSLAWQGRRWSTRFGQVV